MTPEEVYKDVDWRFGGVTSQVVRHLLTASLPPEFTVTQFLEITGFRGESRETVRSLMDLVGLGLISTRFVVLDDVEEMRAVIQREVWDWMIDHNSLVMNPFTETPLGDPGLEIMVLFKLNLPQR